MTPQTLIQHLCPTGSLRAALNMGNPVLAASRTQTEQPAGVTIDLARSLAAELGVPVELMCFESAGKAGSELAAGQADVGFMAIDPLRAQTLAFTAPYVRIEGVYAVREASGLRTPDEVDRPGTTVLVGTGSAYALFLQRELRHARLVEVPTSEGVAQAYLDDPAIDVAAGVRQQLEADARRLPGLRLLPGRFMAIDQAMAIPRERGDEALAFVQRFLRAQQSAGALRQAFERHGIEGATLLEAD
jgi:polar amino acid transport system substrate-binding protein